MAVYTYATLIENNGNNAGGDDNNDTSDGAKVENKNSFLRVMQVRPSY